MRRFNREREVIGESTIKREFGDDSGRSSDKESDVEGDAINIDLGEATRNRLTDAAARSYRDQKEVPLVSVSPRRRCVSSRALSSRATTLMKRA